MCHIERKKNLTTDSERMKWWRKINQGTEDHRTNTKIQITRNNVDNVHCKTSILT